MEAGKVISALNSDLRREILKILSNESMTVIEVLGELNKGGFKAKYRESVYRALEKLFDAGLVEKSYIREKGLCYKTKIKLITIDLTEGIIRASD